MRSMVIPHLEADASTAVQKLGQSFSEFIQLTDSSVLRGYVRAWLRDTFAAFDGAGIKQLMEEARI
jgi:hypothetical protein